jgi:antitoxin (DNA-binding transcriptional repressor) of toxin-antitoxin stability system
VHEIVITRDGRPVARLVPVEPAHTGKRIGIAKGIFDFPESTDSNNKKLFY